MKVMNDAREVLTRTVNRCIAEGAPDVVEVKAPMKAMIVRKGRCAEDGYTEPYAVLEDGRTEPMGWNRSGPIFEVGTMGTAEYVVSPSAGLWRFTPEEEEK